MSAYGSPQGYEALLGKLEQLGDPQYKTFQEGLIPGTQMAYGVRLPQLRALAKEILREDPTGFLAVSQKGSYEEILLRGLVIAGWKLPWEAKRPWVEGFLPLVDNWAVCDSFCNSLKPGSSQDRQAMWEFLRPFYSSGEEFLSRFATVMQLCHFVDQEHLEEGISLLRQVSHPGYYAQMAVAWAFSVWYVSFPQEITCLLEQRVLTPWVQNKTIQKIRESLRVSPQDKKALLAFKLKPSSSH